MDAAYRQRLIADADAGNLIAERLLLQSLLAEQDLNEIHALLQRCRSVEHRQFIEAELSCFHAWAGDAGWQDLLRQSAEAGHAEARQVVSIYHEWARTCDTLAADAGRDVRWAPGWDDWTAPEWTTVLSQHGLTVEQSGVFAPPAVRAQIRAILKEQLKPSAVIDPQTGSAVAHPVRINLSAQWLPELLGWFGKLVESRLAIAGRYEVEKGEVPSLLYYSAGHRYKAHFDCIGGEAAASAAGIEQGGQRTHTVLLSLGEQDFDGGETWFPHLKAGARTAPGELLRFNNTDAEGQPLKSSLHEGREITSGEKLLLSKWVREHPTPYGREIALAASL